MTPEIVPYGSVRGGIDQHKRRWVQADRTGKPVLFVSHAQWRFYGPALPDHQAHVAAARAWVEARAGLHWLRIGAS
jgi:hypothetical protein